MSYSVARGFSHELLRSARLQPSEQSREGREPRRLRGRVLGHAPQSQRAEGAQHAGRQHGKRHTG